MNGREPHALMMMFNLATRLTPYVADTAVRRTRGIGSVPRGTAPCDKPRGTAAYALQQKT